jgi:colanic acid/amylovoran biosynthesis glycosyltransferase
MRVAVFANMKSGLEQFVYRELRCLASRDLSISLFPTRYGEGLYDAEKDWRLHRWHPLPVVAWQAVALLKSPVKYLKLLREAFAYGALIDYAFACYFVEKMADVDVLYATFGDHKLFIAYFCKRILGKPLAVTIHAYELYANPNPRLFVKALKACDHVITVTEHNREFLEKQYGIDPSSVEIVRYGLDLDDYKPDDKFVILIVAFFTDRKAHDVLFEAVKRLGREDIEVWVVGSAAGRRDPVDVEALARQIGVESQVAFFGAQKGNALKAFYRECDVFCLPSRKDSGGAFEGFPNVLIEAMASGKPVITTRHVEIPRIIHEVLVDENDVEGLAQAIERLRRSAPLRAKLGEENRKIAENVFPARNAVKTAELLESLVTSANNTRQGKCS